MDNLDNSNGIFISGPIQNIYNLERPNEHIYNLNDFRIWEHVKWGNTEWINFGSHSSILKSTTNAIGSKDAQEQSG